MTTDPRICVRFTARTRTSLAEPAAGLVWSDLFPPTRGEGVHSGEATSASGRDGDTTSEPDRDPTPPTTALPSPTHP